MKLKILLSIIIFLNLKSSEIGQENLGFTHIGNFTREVDPKYTAYSISLIRNSKKFMVHARYLVAKEEISCHISSVEKVIQINEANYKFLRDYFKLLEKNVNEREILLKGLYATLNDLYDEYKELLESESDDDLFCVIL